MSTSGTGDQSRSLKERLADRLRSYPRAFHFARCSFHLIPHPVFEFQTLRRLGGSYLTSLLARPQDWQRLLPYQAPRTIIYDGDGGIDVLLAASADRAKHGGNTIYLSPETWSESALSALAQQYPPGSGLKLMKRLGGMGAFYGEWTRGRVLQWALSPSHQQQLLLFNFLHVQGIAPRLHDLIELHDRRSRRLVAYVVEHVQGREASVAEWREVMARLQALERLDMLRLIAPDGYHGMGYATPDCNGNLIVDEARRQSFYLDLQDFQLFRYERHLEEMRRRHGETDCREVSSMARLTRSERRLGFNRLLRAADLDLRDRAVFDLSGDGGILAADCLHHGARWVHGLVAAGERDRVEAFLLSIGCTRFSLTSSARAALPPFLRETREAADRVAMSDARTTKTGETLDRLPWRHLLRVEDAVGTPQAPAGCRRLASRVVADVPGRTYRLSAYLRERG